MISKLSTARRVALVGAATMALPIAAAAEVPTEAGIEGVAGPDIVVTARGRVEERRDVPISIQSFDADDLERLGIRDLRALSAFTPGLVVETQYPTTPSIVIRGISTDTADVTAEPRISVYQDGVYLSRPQSALFELFDIERVEVLKGPQPTLFGRSALTGAISIIQNKADPSALAGTIRAGLGNEGHYVGEAMLNLPLAEHAAVRIAGIAKRLGGYVDNLAGGADLNGNRLRALRGSLHVDVGTTRIDVIANGQWDRFTGLSYKSGVFAPADPATGRILGDLDPSSPAWLAAAPDFPRGGLGGRRRLAGTTLLVNTPLGGPLRLSGTAAWTRFRADFVGDFDGTALQIATSGETTRNRQLSGELRLHYEPGGKLSAVIGASVAQERGRQDILIQIDERELLGLQTGVIDRRASSLLPESAYTASATVAAELQGTAGAFGFPLALPLAQALAANLTRDHREQLIRTSRNRFAELFGNLLFEPVERLGIDIGLRYSHEAKRSGVDSLIFQRSVLAGFFGALSQASPARESLLFALAAPGASTIPPSAAYPLPQFGLLYQQTANGEERRSLRGGGFAWRVSARYAVAPALNAYVTYARGRRPEVLSPQAPTVPGAAARFEPLRAEQVDSVEAGLKFRQGSWLAVDGALYAYRYRHFQTELLRGTTLVSLDAGRARAWGGEMSVRYQPADWANLFANYGYNHARFGRGLYEGNHFRLSPDHMVSVGGTVSARLAGGRLEITPSADWRSRLYFDNSNGDLASFAGAFLTPLPFKASQPGYARANLNLGYVTADRRWRIEAFVNNLFDHRYIRDIGTGSLSFGLPSYVAAPPRLIGAAITFRTGTGS